MILATIKLFNYDAAIVCHVEGCLYSLGSVGKDSPQFRKHLLNMAREHLRAHHAKYALEHEIQWVNLGTPPWKGSAWAMKG
jgi:hypothetical protein